MEPEGNSIGSSIDGRRDGREEEEQDQREEEGNEDENNDATSSSGGSRSSGSRSSSKHGYSADCSSVLSEETTDTASSESQQTKETDADVVSGECNGENHSSSKKKRKERVEKAADIEDAQTPACGALGHKSKRRKGVCTKTEGGSTSESMRTCSDACSGAGQSSRAMKMLAGQPSVVDLAAALGLPTADRNILTTKLSEMLKFETMTHVASRASFDARITQRPDSANNQIPATSNMFEVGQGADDQLNRKQQKLGPVPCDGASTAVAAVSSCLGPQRNPAIAETGDFEQQQTIIPSYSTYKNLLESVRPFFQAQLQSRSTMPSSANVNVANEGGERNSDEANGSGGSSGFTSFFTSTVNESNSAGSSSSMAPEEQNTQSGARPLLHHHRGVLSSGSGQPIQTEIQGGYEGDRNDNEREDDSDASVSSMVVLARVKRKHRRRQADELDHVPTRVRIKHDPSKASLAENYAAAAKSAAGAGSSSSLESQNGSDNVQTIGKKKNEQPRSSSSEQSASLSSDNVRVERAEIRDDTNRIVHVNDQRPHIVSAGSSRITSTTAGSSGSGAETSGINSGGPSTSDGLVGSNNNNESSSDPANREEMSGDGKVAVRAEEETSSSGAAGASSGPGPLPVHYNSLSNGKNFCMSRDQGKHDEVYDPPGTTEKERLALKKRKRMDMRKEYEQEVERQMRDSSESSIETELVLKPGKAVKLDEVLSFTKLARVVCQSSPPFLVVHANGAFSSLTGVDSHAAVGRPISALLTLSRPGATKSSDENKDVEAACENGATDENDRPRIDSLVANCGYAEYHQVFALSKPIIGRNEIGEQNNLSGSDDLCGNLTVSCRMSVSPVVSSVGKDHGNCSPETTGEDGDPAARIPCSGTYDLKRRRNHHHHHHQHHKHQLPLSQSRDVTHFVVQLEPIDSKRSRESLTTSTASDTTAEAKLLGLTKGELRRRRTLKKLGQVPTIPGDATGDLAGNQHGDNAAAIDEAGEVVAHMRENVQDQRLTEDEETSSQEEMIVTCG